MTKTQLIIMVVCWLPISFFLHNMIHEGAHALVAWKAGSKRIIIWPFPSKQLGYWTMAHMRYSTVGTNQNILNYVPIAPLYAEVAWMTASTILIFILPIGWWTFLLFIEMVFSLMDVAGWVWPYVTSDRKEFEHTDAAQHLKNFNLTVADVRRKSAILIVTCLLLASVVESKVVPAFVLWK